MKDRLQKTKTTSHVAASKASAGSEGLAIAPPQNRTGLPDELKVGVENLSRLSLAAVRVHYNSSEPAQLQALAYTQGTDVHVASGQERHLPDEAWHAIQQKQGRVKPALQMKSDNPALRIMSSPNGQGVMQLAKSAEELWDGYFEAYNNRFQKPFRHDAQWNHWLQIFFNLEEALYGVKGHVEGWHAYGDDRVQSRYDALAHLGFAPPPVVPDPDVIRANAILVQATARYQAFRANGHINRGAWAGSNTHGAQPGDYVQTAPAVLAVIAHKNLGNWWLMPSDTAPSGRAIHRAAIDERGDFIFHL